MKILWVENNARFVSTAKKLFLSEHEVTVVPDIAGARRRIEAGFDVVIVDYDLDDGKGDGLITDLLTLDPRPSIVAVSSHERGNKAILDAGADAVCPKARFGKDLKALLDRLELPGPCDPLRRSPGGGHDGEDRIEPAIGDMD